MQSINKSPQISVRNINDEDFINFRDFFYKKTGILFEKSKRYFVDKRLVERIEQTKHDNFYGYFNFMKNQASGEELQALINIMTINETYFYREKYQFECMVESLLDKLIKQKKIKSRIRIWSIPSSSGEEPYSIAIYLLEHWPELKSVGVEIISSDIDSNALECCKAGIYNKRSVQYVPKLLINKYFVQLHNGMFKIKDEVRNMVKFTQVNLNNSIQTNTYKNFDVIFCRNLLIYFDDVSRANASNVFFNALVPGGYIFLGHSESMNRISDLFNVCKFPKALTYQKPCVTF